MMRSSGKPAATPRTSECSERRLQSWRRTLAFLHGAKRPLVIRSVAAKAEPQEEPAAALQGCLAEAFDERPPAQRITASSGRNSRTKLDRKSTRLNSSHAN